MEYHVDRIELQQQDTAVVRGQVALDEIAAFVGGAFGEVMSVISAQGLGVAGPPFTRYGMLEGGFEVEAGFPVSAPVKAAGRVVPSGLPGGHALAVLHRGPYDRVADAYSAAESWLGDNSWQPAGNPWEVYLDGPEVSEPRTVVHLPCRPM